VRTDPAVHSKYKFRVCVCEYIYIYIFLDFFFLRADAAVHGEYTYRLCVCVCLLVCACVFVCVRVHVCVPADSNRCEMCIFAVYLSVIGKAVFIYVVSSVNLVMKFQGTCLFPQDRPPKFTQLSTQLLST